MCAEIIMDNFQCPSPMVASMISTILQLKSQVDFMDQFLLLYVPEYVQLKNHVIQTQQNGMAPPTTTTIYPTTSISAQPPSARAHEGINGTTTILQAKANVRRKQPLVKKTPIVPSSAGSAPATIKRRGRKRKHPITTPNDNSVHSVNNYQNIQQAPQNTEGILKIYVPVMPAATNHTINDPRSDIDPNPSNHSSSDNGTKTMSSLDVLAAVSYVLKQKGTGTSPLPVNQDVVPNPTVSVDVNNADQQHNNMDSPSIQGCHYRDSSDEYFKNKCEEREPDGNELSSLSQEQQEHYNQTTNDQSAHYSHSPSSTHNSTTQSQEEYYSVIMGRSPVQELIV